jgi:DNA polymerase elongation subunit (family B)/DNA-directed RNA polymerase subunit RPC12/RpoP
MKILLIDIETAPNTAHVWGLFKQTVSIKQLMESSYVMCWAAKWLGKRAVEFSSVHEDDERDVVRRAWELLDKADAVCHYNGTKFDIPTLNKEFLLHEMGPPSPYTQIDLLKVARQQFKFPSNRLDYVAQALGVGKKTPHEGHELWVKCMNDDPAAWRKMKRYNVQDVRLLEDVYGRLLPWIKGHPNHALYKDTDRPTCTNCGSENLQSRGKAHTKTQTYKRYQCQDCGTWLRSRLNNTENKENVLVAA